MNGIEVDPRAEPLELLITPGATGAVVAIARTYLADASALVFEPYYPYHRRIPDELGGRTEVLQLRGNISTVSAILKARGIRHFSIEP